MNLTAIQLKHVRAINKILGLNNSTHTNHVISKEIMTKPIIDYLTNHIQELRSAFDSKVKMTGLPKNDNKNGLALVQKIYGNWSSLKIKKHEVDSRSKIATSYITDSYDFYNHIK